MPQAGRLCVRFPMSLDFSIYLILPVALSLWSRLSLLTEMSTKDLPRGKKRPARKADNLTAICEPTVSQPYGSPRRATETPLLVCTGYNVS
jgi:hypothetical protein